jgi:AraC-like DNA-binding protein
VGSIDRTLISTDPKRSMVVSSGNTIKFSTSADYERFALTIKSAALKSKLEAITGNCIGAFPKFEIKKRHSDFATQALRQNCFFLVEAMGTSPPIPRPVLSQLEQTIIVMFLHANRHNYSHLLEEEQPAAASWQVRRAEEYLGANCAEMPNLEAIAAETNVSILSLVRGFRRNRGCSPSEFVRQVRSGRAGKAATNSAVTATVTNLSDTPGCPRCGERMRLIQTLPKTTVLPKLQSYQCLPCRELVTQLVRDR